MDLDAMGEEIFRRNSSKRWCHYRLSRVRARLRIASNIGLIIGQCLLLFFNRDVGLAVIIASSLLSFPYFFHEKMWDVVALMVFLNVVNVVGLFVQ